MTTTIDRMKVMLAACIGLAAVLVQPAEAARKYVAIGTGGHNGVYFIAGHAICRLVQKSHKDLRCSSPSTGGSIYNLEAVRDGVLDLGIVQSDWQHHAYKGTSKFEGRRMPGLRSLFSIHPEAFQLVVGRDSGIRRWRDLRGKRVNIGNPDSGARGTFEALMIAEDVDGSFFSRVTQMSSDQHSNALCDGRIDAYGYMVGVPSEDIASVVGKCGARLIPLKGDNIDRLLAESSFYAPMKIPQGTYATVEEPTDTFAVMATVVASVDTDEVTVYKLVKSVFENIDEFRRLHPAFKHLDPARMTIDGLTAPLHPGAARYYKEKGWIR